MKTQLSREGTNRWEALKAFTAKHLYRTTPCTSDADQFAALIGLAATRSETANACPSAELLAQFIDNQAHSSDRQTMIHHLSQCSQCRNHWLESVSFVADQQIAYNTPAPQGDAARPACNDAVWPNPLASLQHWLGGNQLWKPALAGVFTLLFISIWLLPTSATKSINFAYQEFQTYYKQLPEKHNLDFLLTPNNYEAWGLTASTSSPMLQAFGAGVFDGTNLLRNTPAPRPAHLNAPTNTTWQQGEWSDYYELGRWSLLLFSQLDTDYQLLDWQRHQAIFASLRDQFINQEQQDAHTQHAQLSLQRLDAILTKSTQDLSPHDLDSVKRELRITIQTLYPL